MISAFNETDAKQLAEHYADIPEGLALRIYTSRLIGQNPQLVLHGGGNTSVKLIQKNVFAEKQEILYVKGSGVDLASIDVHGFSGLDLTLLRKLRNLNQLSDEEMENQLEVRKVNSSLPNPSVEALLHAFLPHKYIDHTHADSVLVLTNQKHGTTLIKKALGPKVAVLPYTLSGLPLAKEVASQYEKDTDIEAVVILNHGIFTFGEDAKTSYERMIDYVNKAEAFVNKEIQGKALMTPCSDITSIENMDTAIARVAQTVRGVCAHQASDGSLRRFYVETRNEPDLLKISLARESKTICTSGVLTPDHAIRTKNRMVFIEHVPDHDHDLKNIITQKVESFKQHYHSYFNKQLKEKGLDRKQLDPYPRVFLIAGLGLMGLGFTRKDARIAADIAEHTVRAKLNAGALDEYIPILDSHIFDMEYWSLQQKKLHLSLSSPLLQGQVAVITGGGGAIGFGIADRLLANGAVVVLSDIDQPRLKKVRSILIEKYSNSQVEVVPFDVTQYFSVEKAFEKISRRLGGIDLVIPNAGIAHVARIEDLDPDKLDQVMAVNLKGTFTTIKASVPIFKRQGTGGNIVVISSKNVFDPGAAFGAYSASKAGAHQISKIAALELAEIGVRVNMINPDAVFGDEKISSKLWDLIGPDRMKCRGLDCQGLKEYYHNRNLLKASVLAEHVGNAVVFFAGNQTPTTGASLPVDGGIPAAFPR
ncbi:MAG: bifunctional aldolase/short-chain dehydrogenase [Thermodesulfobacteriota bacterium]|nr:bifunctional aldolase/short-chain dehydrogenase [Thermodesulfobacteriota bacterium]